MSDNDSGVASVYSGGVKGRPVALELTVPVPGGGPTGQVFNPTLSLAVSKRAFPVGGSSGMPADFIVATLAVGTSGPAGEIEAWNGQSSFVVEDSPSGGPGGTTPAGSLFTGLAASAHSAAGPELYAADATGQRIDVFDSTFAPLDTSGRFTDPALPADYTPYNVQDLGGEIYAAYAELNRHHTGPVAGQGTGVVDVYDVDGVLLHHLISNGPSSPLDAPWGLAIAPKGFGAFAGQLLVGNLGNGRINVFDPHTGKFLGTLDDAHGHPIVIPGLWGLRPGNATFGGSRSLVFSSGPDGYRAGLVGVLNPAG